MTTMTKDSMLDFTAKQFSQAGCIASIEPGEFEANSLGLASMDGHAAIEFLRSQPTEAEAYRDELRVRIARLKAGLAIYEAALAQVDFALLCIEGDEEISGSANHLQQPN